LRRRHEKQSAVSSPRSAATRALKFDARSGRPRRGVAIVAFVAALLVIGTMTLWLFQLTATGSSSNMGHFYSACALYAAESGLEMALYEKNVGEPDHIDSSGTDGTISDDGNPANDPALVTGAFYVAPDPGGAPNTFRVTGRPQQAATAWTGIRRSLRYRLE